MIINAFRTSSTLWFEFAFVLKMSLNHTLYFFSHNSFPSRPSCIPGRWESSNTRWVSQTDKWMNNKLINNKLKLGFSKKIKNLSFEDLQVGLSCELSLQIQTVLVTDDLPELGPNLVATLTNLEVYNLSHLSGTLDLGSLQLNSFFRKPSTYLKGVQTVFLCLTWHKTLPTLDLIFINNSSRTLKSNGGFEISGTKKFSIQTKEGNLQRKIHYFPQFI